jgi:hypothetical protein
VISMLRTAVIALLASATLLVAEHSAIAQAQSASADDTARILAGMPPSSGSPLAALTQDPAWQQHARRFDSVFGNLDKNQFSKIRAWSSAKLTSPSPVLFYMFSGPDFLYADAFFPSASTYVMAGLEPTGPIPDVQRLPRGAVGEALRHIEGSLSTILTISFFKTKDMRMTLGANRLSGTLPLLYVFLARTGKTIQDVSLIKLDDQGTPQPLNAPSSPAMRNPAQGVKIVFSGADGTARTLYYFGTNIANDGFKSSGFEKFVARLGVGDGFVKSASYLMHGPGFSADQHHFAGRHRHTSRLFPSRQVAAPAVWSLYRSDPDVCSQLSAQVDPAVPERARRTAQFRARLSMARTGIEPAARDAHRAAGPAGGRPASHRARPGRARQPRRIDRGAAGGRAEEEYEQAERPQSEIPDRCAATRAIFHSVLLRAALRRRFTPGRGLQYGPNRAASAASKPHRFSKKTARCKELTHRLFAIFSKLFTQGS